MSSPSAINPQELRYHTLRPLTVLLALWNMGSWALYATSDWFADGEPMTLFMMLHFALLVIVQPLVSLPALYFAWKNVRLKLAFWLAAIPWIFYVLGVLAFAIGVGIHGF